MGYHIFQVYNKTKFNIKAENKLSALRATRLLSGKETCTDSSGKHFSWVRTEDFVNLPTLEAVLDEWRWRAKNDEAGNIIHIDFTGEKYGDDTLLFQQIAPFVEAGSVINMKGEDGALFRWRFDGKKCYEEQAEISVKWPEEPYESN